MVLFCGGCSNPDRDGHSPALPRQRNLVPQGAAAASAIFVPSSRRLCSCCCCFYVFDVCALLMLLLMLSPPLLLLLRLLMLLLLPLLLLPVVPLLMLLLLMRLLLLLLQLLLLLLLLEAPDNHPMPPVQRGLFGTQFVSPPTKQAKRPRVVRSAATDAVETQLGAQAAPQIPPAESQELSLAQALSHAGLSPLPWQDDEKAMDDERPVAALSETTLADLLEHPVALVAEASNTGTIVVSPPLTVGHVQPYCTKCGYHVDPCSKGVRVISKTPPTFKCQKCNSMQCTLHKLFGTWPLDEFKALGEETQQKFWREAGGSREGLKQSVEQLLVRKVVEKKFASEAGPFLPLSVWATQGYNTDDIAARASMEVHPVLGPTYQVSIKSSGREKTDSLIQEQMLRLLEKGKKSTAGTSGDRDILLDTSSLDKAEEEDIASKESVNSSSASSSGSSSDSSGKKKKKKKNTAKSKKSKKSNKNKQKDSHSKKEQEKKDKEKKDKKEITKQRLAVEKAERARVSKIKSDCTKALAKIAPVMLYLEELLKHTKLSLVPSFAVQKAKLILKKLEAVDGEARAQLKAKDPKDVTFTLPVVAMTTKEAMETKSLVEGMLDAVNKHCT